MRRTALLFLFFIGLVFTCSRAEEVLQWKDCLSEAKKNNPDLISAVEVVDQQKAQKTITASALYPQITANMDASTARADTGNSSATADSYSYGVSGTQLVFDGFNTINKVNAASENIKAAQQTYRFTSSEVRLSLRTAFVNLLEAQEAVHVAEEIIKIRRDNLELITLRYYSGLEHRGALMTADANLQEALFELAQAKRAIESAQSQLNQAMGRKEFHPVSAKGDFTVADSARVKPDLDELTKNHPSYLQAVAQKNSAAFGIKSAYANFFPQLSGNAGAGKGGMRWPPHGDEWNLGLNLSLPVFEGGLRVAQVKQAKALYLEMQANEKSVKDTVLVNLQLTWAALQNAIESVDVQLKTLEASQERSRIAQAQYSIGLLTFDNWTIIEDDLVRAKNAYLLAQANALTAEANWIQAKGETLEYAQ